MNKIFKYIPFFFCSLCSYEFSYGQDADLSFLTKRIVTYGNISKDTLIQHNFKFKNNSDQILEIKNIYKSCTCTNVIINKKIFYPYEEGLIRTSINTTGKMGKQEIIIHIIANTKEEDHIMRISYIIN